MVEAVAGSLSGDYEAFGFTHFLEQRDHDFITSAFYHNWVLVWCRKHLSIGFKDGILFELVQNRLFPSPKMLEVV